ncbi:MAG: lipase family protein [Pseudomonadota bacterium]
MPEGSTLTPKEAAHIATNSYFTLENWINEEPVAGVAAKPIVQNRVMGPADIGSSAHADTSLRDTDLGDGKLGGIYRAQTGFGVSSGFGYTLAYEGQGLKHAIIATRGTRPEMKGKPDLITDVRGSITPFGNFGPVHKGFKTTFDSLMPSLIRDRAVIESADVIHCVGHSLGGAVATLVAGHYAKAGKSTKLYTFGSPRVGCFDTFRAFEKAIGVDNIYRVAHDLDPITLIGPFPFIHVLPSPANANNMTLLSPTGRLFSTANHDMAEYINSVGNLGWNDVRSLSKMVDHDNALVARWLLHGDSDPGWIKYASVQTLGLLFKLFSNLLRTVSTSLILGLTAVDLLAEVLLKGLHKLNELGNQIYTLLKYAAQWAGITAIKTADFTAGIIKAILVKMLDTMKLLASEAMDFLTRNITPLTIGLAGTWALQAYGVL